MMGLILGIILADKWLMAKLKKVSYAGVGFLQFPKSVKKHLESISVIWFFLSIIFRRIRSYREIFEHTIKITTYSTRETLID